ncbi:Na-translocating system protein MpsC family protein [Melghirimyces profundicolus]|uniref:Na-translocating system protein MpsC family protein n=1 Tax=Melghirimyces profundicolus TaxID=1242148 RepID=UPI001FEC4C75|nr:Na-translocating system protein MpsC family protein [Melghirimyces profundicolus]
MNTNQFKQKLISDYNEINMQLFDVGTKEVRVNIIDNKILIMAVHRRVKAIRSIDKKNRLFTRQMDVLLIDEFKKKLCDKIKTKYGFQVVSILKDYDPLTEWSATVIVLESNVETHLIG